MDDTKRIRSPRIRKILASLLLGTALVTAGGIMKTGVHVQDYEPKAAKGFCTILVYMVGSDLEGSYGAATEDLGEMEKALQESEIASEDVHVVVEAGGSQNWEYPAMKGKEYGRFCVTGEGAEEFEDMEARDMGEEDTLADFINYGIQSYPAEHYGLVFWNHGSGQISGFGCDSQFDDSSLSLNEIAGAMDHSAMDEKFSFIGLDACLMGNIELAAVLEEKAEYLIASEELEPESGYDYSWLCSLADEIQRSPEDMGSKMGIAMLDSYEGYYKDCDYKLTLSMMDLSAYKGFHDCFNKMMEKTEQMADNRLYQELGRQRKKVQGFGNLAGGSHAEIVDLMDLMEQIAEITGDADGYKQLGKQHKLLVPEKITKGYGSEPSGTSIYLPAGCNEWFLQNMSVYKEIPFCSAYHQFLQKYQDYLTEEDHIDWHSLEKKQQEIMVQVKPEEMDRIAAAYLTVFHDAGREGMAYLLSTDSDVLLDRAGFPKAVPEKQYWGMKDEILCLIETLDTEEYTEYISPVWYRGEICLMYISFSKEDQDGRIRAIAPIGVKKKQYELQEGDTLYPLYPLEQWDGDGRAEVMPQGSSGAAVTGKGVAAGVKSGEIYQDSYYVGKQIRIDSLEEGDADLMLVDADVENCMFGFMIQDTKQNLYYTDFLSGRQNPIGKKGGY